MPKEQVQDRKHPKAQGKGLPANKLLVSKHDVNASLVRAGYVAYTSPNSEGHASSRFAPGSLIFHKDSTISKVVRVAEFDDYNYVIYHVKSASTFNIIS